MSSSEPPSRIPPRQQPHETKAARDELSSKGKVEKVREVDADEETRKKKFLKYYQGEMSEEDMKEGSRPTPFDLYSGKMGEAEGPLPTAGGGLSLGDDVGDAIVPAPAYAPPPNVNTPFEGGEEDEAMEGALPQSEDFWEEFDFPDQPTPSANFQETPGLSKRGRFEQGPQQAKAKQADEEGYAAPLAAGRAGTERPKEGRTETPKGGQEKGKGILLPPEKKELEPSVFGPPGKAIGEKRKSPQQKTPFEKEPSSLKRMRPEEEKGREIPRRAALPPLKKGVQPKEALPSEAAALTPKVKPIEKEEERYLGPVGESKFSKETKEKEGERVLQELGALPIKPEEREGRGGGGGKREKEEKGLEIEAPSLPALPMAVQPMATSAANQATPYLNPRTIPLFFQMVGMVYVMAGEQGVSRTEVVLNNPAYANSKFYGATIRIEKYATAPDSFNITLTGSDEAVASFKENIPSLITAFENGNFAFRINRLDVEYSLERPIFRRKERSSEKGEGDLGERKK